MTQNIVAFRMESKLNIANNFIALLKFVDEISNCIVVQFQFDVNRFFMFIKITLYFVLSAEPFLYLKG